MLTVFSGLRHALTVWGRYRVGLLAPLIVIALLGSASAQYRTIQVEGWIQWISGERMMLVVGPGQSVTVELRDVPQDQYMGLKPRDSVIVVGVLSGDNRRVSATTVAFSAPGWVDQSP